MNNKHVTFLAAGAIGIGLLSLNLISQGIRVKEQKEQAAKEEIPSIQSLNAKLKATGAQYRGAKTPNARNQALQEIKEAAELRKGVMLALIREDPKQANALALSETERAGLPEEVQDMLEEQIETEGLLEILHIDYFDEGRSDNIFFLQATDGKRYELHLPSVTQPFVSNTKVKVKGVELDQNVAVSDEEGVVILE